MKEKKECPVCGSEFEPKSKKGVYCSSVCRQKDYRRRLAPIIVKGREFSAPYPVAGPKAAVALHNAENKDQFTQACILSKKEADELFGRDKANGDDIQKQIDEIKAEKIPKERDTPMGRKVWQMDQHKRIQELQNKLK